MKSLFFQHDYSARNDERIIELRAAYGWEGYGLFFALVEMMAENGGHLNTSKLKVLAYGLSVDADWLQGFIAFCLESGLMYLDNGLLRSKRLDKHFDFRQQCAERGREGGYKSGRWRDKPAEPSAEQSGEVKKTSAEPSAINKEIKDTKEKKEIYFVAQRPPSQEEVMLYFAEIEGTDSDAARFHDHFTANGWRVSGRAAMKDWKAAARNWNRNAKQFSKNGNGNTSKGAERVDSIASLRS